MSQFYSSPNVLIFSTTRNLNEDLAGAVDFIRDQMLQVDVVTFTQEDNYRLLELAIYGGVHPGNYQYIKQST